MEMERSLLLDRLTGRILAIPGQREQPDLPVRVAIDGVDAAGKSTFAAALAAALRAAAARSASPPQVIEASLDGFHRPRAERYRQGHDSASGYYQDSFDLPALRRVLLDPLGPQGGTGPRLVRTALFDLAADAPLESAPILAAPGALLVFDGIFLQRPELAGCWELIIFLQVSQATMLARAVQRDQAHLGGPQAAAERYARRYLPAQQNYLATCRPAENAGILIRNDTPDRPEILRW